LRRIWWQSGTDDAMIDALKSIEPIGFLSFAPASAGTNRADVNRRIIRIARTAEERLCPVLAACLVPAPPA
jgi:hypothetical protein